MKHVAAFLSLFLLALISADTAQAQDEMMPKKYENASWKGVSFVKYHAGQRGRALEIIREYYRPASDKAGTPTPQLIEMQTGEWDLMLVWSMDEGVEAMNWEISPNSLKWRQALNEVAGGADKATEIMQEYSSLVDEGAYEIGFVRMR